MEFSITRIGQFFLIRSPEGQFIPRANPSTVTDIVLQIRQEHGVNPNGIRFFWPDDDEIDMIVAVLPDSV
jgi:hypothetical protein